MPLEHVITFSQTVRCAGAEALRRARDAGATSAVCPPGDAAAALELGLVPLLESSARTNGTPHTAYEIPLENGAAGRCRFGFIANWRRLAADDARLLEVAQAIGQQVGGDAGHAGLQIRVSEPAAEQQLAHDEQGPAIADEFERLGQRAVLVVAPHASILAAMRENRKELLDNLK